ncbi:MAG: protein-disulfide reductase DsbD [Tibeticola sp.]
MGVPGNEVAQQNVRRRSPLKLLVTSGIFYLLLAFSWGVGSALAEGFLSPEEAFPLRAEATDGRTLRFHWDVPNGYHLYRDRIEVVAGNPAVQIASLKRPDGKVVWDSNFGRNVAVFDQPVDIEVQLVSGPPEAPLIVRWQGCADAGLCYPPQERLVKAALTSLGASNNTVTIADDTAATPAPIQAVRANTAPAATASTPQSPAETATDETGQIAAAFSSGSAVRVAGVFLLAGLLLSLTPCVLPMVPILSSVIVGQEQTPGRARGFLLALSYSLGMALVYSAFGAAAGLMGEGLAAALQTPWVLTAFALLLVVLSLSMFGLYELQMPSFIQSRATEWSNRFKGGSLTGTFLMGGVSALVVGPCVAAPLAGALMYISQSRDVWLGSLALFSMAMGMSVPLLLVGLSAGSLLPRVGPWMTKVKSVFGLMLLGVAIWTVSPVIPVAAQMLLWAAWMLGIAALFGLFDASTSRPSPLRRAAGTAFAAVAAVLLVGAASGGQSVLQPLAHLKPQAAVAATTSSHAAFERITKAEDFERILADAKNSNQMVMLDLYADWCVACKEFETLTFSDPVVMQKMQPMRLVQLDITANAADHKALLKRFGLFGPPAILFFKPGQSTPAHTVIGFQNATAFSVSIDRAKAA